MVVNGSDECNKALSFANMTSGMVSMNVPHIYITLTVMLITTTL